VILQALKVPIKLLVAGTYLSTYLFYSWGMVVSFRTDLREATKNLGKYKLTKDVFYVICLQLQAYVQGATLLG
jgi:hypothetical protein